MTRVSKSTLNRLEREERAAMRSTDDAGGSRATPARNSTRDSYQNFAASLGIGTQNALSSSTYGFNPITRIRVLIEWIYRGSWLGAVAVDIPAEDMTRGGIEIHATTPPKDIEKIQKALTRLGIWARLQDCVKWASLYGGSIGALMIDGQDVTTPLQIDRIGKGAFKGILVLDRWMLNPSLSDLITEMGPEIGKPKYYEVVPDAPAFRGKKIHHSRCLRFEGIKLPFWQAVMENLWGLSVFERLYDRMVAFDSATMGMAQLVYKSFLRTYKVKSFRKILSEGGKAEEALIKSVHMLKAFHSNEGIGIIDAEDDMVAMQNNSFSGIAEAVLHLVQQMAGGLKMPLTRIYGQSPAGLNSTGESDLRTYYDGIKQDQETDMRMPVEKLIRITAKSESINLPENFGFDFVSLWQLSEKEKSEIFARDSAAIADLKADGIIRLVTAVQELRQLSRVTGRMTNITDADIAAAEAAEPAGEAPIPTAAPPGERPEEGNVEADPEEPSGKTLAPKQKPKTRLRAVGE